MLKQEAIRQLTELILNLNMHDGTFSYKTYYLTSEIARFYYKRRFGVLKNKLISNEIFYRLSVHQLNILTATQAIQEIMDVGDHNNNTYYRLLGYE